MRIRSTKPEFWKSKRIASVSWEDRLLLKGLESYVDDNGVGVDDVELIVTDVFPRDMFANPRETVARVSEGISRLFHAGLIHRYSTESDSLLYVSFWEDIQRIDKPGKGRYPRPDGTMDYKSSSIRESVASPPETLAPGTGEQGNRGTGEQGIKPSDPADAKSPTTVSTYPQAFEDFWNVYPKKADKRAALKAWNAATKRAGKGAIEAGAEAYRDDPNRQDSFTKNPATWLNADAWANGPLPSREPQPWANKATQRQQDQLGVIANLAEYDQQSRRELG